jgi:hypothetical protein
MQTAADQDGTRFPKSLGVAVIALAVVAAVVFVGVGVPPCALGRTGRAGELLYASNHPYAYGPAKVIAWGAGAGTLLSVAIVLLAFGLTRTEHH